MKKILLLKFQKNETFELIREAGLNPLDFKWGQQKTDCEGQSYNVSILKYLRNALYFKFDRNESGEYTCRFFPGAGVLEEKAHHYGTKWLGIINKFKEWLSYLQRESNPDLWEQMKEYSPREELIHIAGISNTPFSYAEVEALLESLDELQSKLEMNFKLQGKNLAFVKSQIKYLKDAAKRQGKKDWLHTSIGVIAGIAVNLALSPENAKLLWELVKSCFGGVLLLPAP